MWARHTNRQYGGMLIGFISVLVIQLMAFTLGSCSSSYKPLFGNTIINIFLAIVIGFITALIAYLSTSLAGGLKYDPFPTSTTAGGAGGTGGNSNDGGTTGEGDKKHKHHGYGTSQAVQDTENTFVAELYKNGQLVTDSIAA